MIGRIVYVTMRESDNDSPCLCDCVTASESQCLCVWVSVWLCLSVCMNLWLVCAYDVCAYGVCANGVWRVCPLTWPQV